MTQPRKRNGIEVALIERIAAADQAAQRTCEKKRRYADEFAARAAGIYEMTDQQLYIYRCRHCRGWHLTRMEQPAYWAVDYFEKEGYK